MKFRSVATTLLLLSGLGSTANAQPAITATGQPASRAAIRCEGDVAQAKGPVSEATVKAFIQRAQTRIATGVGSSPKSGVVTFESIKMGTPRVTSAYDRSSNGVTADKVYPVRAKYSVLQTWGNGETEVRPWNYDYDFYLDPYGEWTAISVGPVQ